MNPPSISDSTPQILNYQIVQTVYDGSRAVVYRAVRIEDRLPVAIKLLKNPYPNSSELLQFRHQYTITQNLSQPGIVQTYSLEPYHHSYALVMEDFGGISLKAWADQTGSILSVADFLEVAIAICHPLETLYRERIIHKDLKPANILINPETREVKIIDFSIASLLPRENQSLLNPQVLEGTLAYVSPEQTGRMNRGLDYRTDIYSLGITFYELLTGELPFQTNDPMELVHCHLAKQPLPVHQVNPTIPPALSAIVGRMMAKNAEDRYQSAWGLRHDLEKCQQQLQTTGAIELFALGDRDVTDRFLIPDRLYGREPEVTKLLQAFERVVSFGITEMILVAGFSGIGKTAVVNEIHKPIVRQRSYFIKGKYDQFNRHVPLSAFVQAFRDLIAQLLGENDLQLQQWRTRILAALGESGQVILDVLPELEQIIGSQPPVPELSGGAAQNRFNLLFSKFVRVFTTPEHPLVLFLDDLQWADSASLNLIKLLMGKSLGGYLLLIGAYRDNEVFPAHPLCLTLNDIAKISTVETITLTPLSWEDVHSLITDTLSCQREVAQPLTELVYQKANGNPFFTTQFLKALHEDGIITFNSQLDSPRRGWSFDLAQGRSISLLEGTANDVVDFMAVQLQKLPIQTQTILKLAACIGNQFDLATLAIVSEQLEVEIATDLWQALQEGLILPVSNNYKLYQGFEQRITPDSSQDSSQDSNQGTARSFLNLEVLESSKQPARYKFLHDRIQQAAYSLIPDQEKQLIHYSIGQLLLNHTPESQQPEKVFDIVNQLNYGVELIDSPIIRNQLARLNLVAARKAKAANAYLIALNYLTVGINLLAVDRWQNNYDLTLKLYVEATETAYLCNDFEQMQQLAEIVLQSVTTLFDKIKIYETKILACAAQIHLQEAVEMGLQVLQLLGITFPEQPTFADIQQGLTETSNNLQQEKLENLILLSEMTDPEKLGAMLILSSIAPSVFKTTPTLYPLIVFTQVNLSIKYGNTHLSAFAYSGYGLILCGVFQNIELGYQVSNLAKQLLSKLNANELKAKILAIDCGYIKHWQEHLKVTLPDLRLGYQAGLESGDLEFTAYCIFFESCHLFYMGEELQITAESMKVCSQAINQLSQETSFYWIELYRLLVSQLMGHSFNLYNFQGDKYGEDELLLKLSQANDRLGLHILHSNKMILAYLLGRDELAISSADLALEYLDGVTGMFAVPIFHFYDSLIQISLVKTNDPQNKINDRIKSNQQKLQQWSDYAPVNYLHKFYLVEAEKYRITDHKYQAGDFYDRAISLAKENQFLQEEALANELAAKFYLDWGRESLAQTYMTAAYYCYARWGATAKVADLESRYPQLLTPIIQQSRLLHLSEEAILASGITLDLGNTLNNTLGNTLENTLGNTLGGSSTNNSGSRLANVLDFAALLKASQTISGEIELEKLLSSILHIIIANAGADKCVFILKEEAELLVRATARPHLKDHGDTEVAFQSLLNQHQPVTESAEIPLSLINTVSRSLEPVVILNAAAYPQLINDAYIQQWQPQSILCSPILRQGNLLGILYLENSLITGAFTSDRLELLNFLCTQAAISLENAQLYTHLQERERFLSSIYEGVGCLIFASDLRENGRFEYTGWSKSCETALGIPADQVLGKTPHELSPERGEIAYQKYLKCFQSGVPITDEESTMVNGQEIWWLTTLSPLKDATGKVYRLIGTTIDISDRKQAEKAILQKSQELEIALQNLQNAQLQIVQSEKMSALGNLVAGVAHEINNPISFIAGNLVEARRGIQDLIDYLQLYQAKLPPPDAELIEKAEEIDVDYLLEDLPKMLESMQTGCDRIKFISKSLRTFSRGDQDHKVPFDIHEGIDSTVLILKHRLRANERRSAIEVVTNYSDLPKVYCFPGQINQVFMNILANAIDAIEEASHEYDIHEAKVRSNQITITTSLITSPPISQIANQETNQETNLANQQLVKISIADNGGGMSREVQQKVFDHLFTTKEVGKGTGLGLAIARQIVVEKHGGTIDVNSVLGTGTQFIITLPA
jgi:PAS domain S-box-containing protein